MEDGVCDIGNCLRGVRVVLRDVWLGRATTLGQPRERRQGEEQEEGAKEIGGAPPTPGGGERNPTLTNLVCQDFVSTVKNKEELFSLSFLYP